MPMEKSPFMSWLKPRPTKHPSFSAVRRAGTCKSVSFFRGVVLLLLFCSPSVAAGQEQLVYRVRYDLAELAMVHISLNFATPSNAPLTLIVPRTVPGGYAQRLYDTFVANVEAYSVADTTVEVRREELGPRWKIGKSGERGSRVAYVRRQTVPRFATCSWPCWGTRFSLFSTAGRSSRFVWRYRGRRVGRFF